MRTDIKLTERERNKVICANSLLKGTISLVEEISAVDGVAFIEHPDDPEAEPYASIWILPMMLEMLQRSAGFIIRLCQCRFGTVFTKPTRM